MKAELRSEMKTSIHVHSSHKRKSHWIDMAVNDKQSYDRRTYGIQRMGVGHVYRPHESRAARSTIRPEHKRVIFRVGLAQYKQVESPFRRCNIQITRELDVFKQTQVWTLKLCRTTPIVADLEDGL